MTAKRLAKHIRNEYFERQTMATLTVSFTSPQPNSRVGRTLTVSGSISLEPATNMRLGNVLVTFGNRGDSVKATVEGHLWGCTGTVPPNNAAGSPKEISLSSSDKTGNLDCSRLTVRRY
jgi:hypothetical protein